MVRNAVRAALALLFFAPGMAMSQQAPAQGTEEFGLTPRELAQAIEKVEELISKCMREEGFQYVAADYRTVRAGMTADKRLPGLSEEEFINKHGYGLATLYTGQPPQLATGYSPGRVGLGERNIQYFRSLSPADQVAYNRALLGQNTNVTFAIALEMENFSNTGGCTRSAVGQVFKPEQLTASYYNPQDSLVNSDPRMKAALQRYAQEMKKAGFDYSHPDEVEPDIRARLAALTSGGTILELPPGDGHVGRADDDRGFAVEPQVPHLLRDDEAAHFRHDEIEHHHVEMARVESAQRFGAGAAGFHLMADGREDGAENVEVAIIVVDNEDVARGCNADPVRSRLIAPCGAIGGHSFRCGSNGGCFSSSPWR